jgi:hypothetical protein
LFGIWNQHCTPSHTSSRREWILSIAKEIEEIMFRSKPLNQKACDDILIRKNEKKLFNDQDVRIEEN